MMITYCYCRWGNYEQMAFTGVERAVEGLGFRVQGFMVEGWVKKSPNCSLSCTAAK